MCGDTGLNIISPNDYETLLIEKSVSAGQTIVFDGNVVILGDVLRGAEIIAMGHIIVIGRIYGFVHAGSKGDTNATVSSDGFYGELLRISGCSFNFGSDFDSPGISVVAFIHNGGIAFSKR